MYYNFFLNQKAKLAYVSIPKVACSSVKASYFNKLPHNQKLTMPQIHDNSLYDIVVARSENTVRDIVESYFVFTVIRDPVARFLSAYNDKIYRFLDGSLKTELTLTKQYFNQPIQINGQIDRLIDHLDSDQVNYDAHFRLQSKILLCDLNIFDHVSKIEDISKLFGLLNQKIIPRPEYEWMNNHKAYKYDQQYPSDRKSYLKLYNIYAPDYDLFKSHYDFSHMY